MRTVASRDLRNHTADVLRAVADGARVTVTVNGRAVAEIGPVTQGRPLSLSRARVIDLLTRHQADPGMRADLEALGDAASDEVGPPA